MQEWRADSFYEFGEVVSLKSFIYFCLSFKTESHPSELSDWLKVDLISPDLPEKGSQGEVLLTEHDEKCFIFNNGWEEVSFKKESQIIFSNRNPSLKDEGRIWINEIEGLIFKQLKEWEQVNCGDEEIFEHPFKPTRLDDENDTSGNGVITEGSLWVDYKHNKVYVNVDPSHKLSIWKKI